MASGKFFQSSGKFFQSSGKFFSRRARAHALLLPSTPGTRYRSYRYIVATDSTVPVCSGTDSGIAAAVAAIVAAAVVVVAEDSNGSGSDSSGSGSGR